MKTRTRKIKSKPVVVNLCSGETIEEQPIGPSGERLDAIEVTEQLVECKGGEAWVMVGTPEPVPVPAVVPWRPGVYGAEPVAEPEPDVDEAPPEDVPEPARPEPRDQFVYLLVAGRSTNLAQLYADEATMTNEDLAKLRTLDPGECAFPMLRGLMTTVRRQPDRFVVESPDLGYLYVGDGFAKAVDGFFRGVREVKKLGGSVTMLRNGEPYMEAVYGAPVPVEARPPKLAAAHLFHKAGTPCPTCGHVSSKPVKTHEAPSGDLVSLAERRRAAALKAVATRRARAAGGAS